MTKQALNTNRDLPPDQVVALFKKRLPSLTSGLGADRNWLWWAGPKPDETTRKVLGEMGWRFSGKPHQITKAGTDKLVAAHWYHSCGGKVVFRRKGAPPADSGTEDAAPPVSNSQQSTRKAATAPRRPAERVTPSAPPPASGAVGNLLNLSKFL